MPCIRKLVVVLISVLMAACADDDPRGMPVSDASAFDRPPGPGAEVVATVNGARIYAEDVARQAGLSGITPRAALDELIRLELLFQEAQRRGFLDDPGVEEVRRSAQVRAFLAGEFEPRLATAAQVPDSYVRQAWENNAINSYFNHPRYHKVSYVRVPVPDKAPPAEDAKARRLAATMRQRLVAAKPKSHGAFQEAAGAAAAELGISIEGSAEKLLPVARHGSHVEEFAKAAFDLARPGDISQPARTSWGYDILYLDGVIPERSDSLEKAKPEIQAKLLDSVRQKEFLAFVQGLVNAAKVERQEQLLEQVVVESPLAGAP